MNKLVLDGTWHYRRINGDECGVATVPGDIYRDLLDNKQISDPFYRDNERGLQWIGESNWVFSREFDVPDAFAGDRLVLRCHGLDTFASVTINGTDIGTADNMFRTWEWDVTPYIEPGVNTLSVTFDSVIPYAQEKQNGRFLPWWRANNKVAACHGWVRKEQCNFGWDWGIKAVTCGIWRSIELLACNAGHITQLAVRQVHRGGAVSLSIDMNSQSSDNGELTAVATLRKGGEVLCTQALSPAGTSTVEILDPQLWWPNGMGGQPLYDLEVQLLNSGEVVEACTKRIGLRTLTLDRHADEWGESFQFVVNGRPFFAKGANWIPADGILSRMTHERYHELILAAVDANMNMLRVWGGGLYEADSFYDLCDERGICVWQDFMFACSTYPTFDEDFVESVRHEATDNVKRLHHHACIALWCGNNEVEMGLVGPEWNDCQMSWGDYKTLFDECLPEVVARYSPDTDYWPASPHTPVGDRAEFNNQDSGDAHLWDVWHGKKPFEWYRTCQHRFNSEFGFQSFPEPKTVKGYTEEKDRNITSWVMEHHQRSGIGNTTIMQYMLDWFRLPHGFENTLWTSQILQGMAIKYACEHWRRSMPRGMGTLYWQFNDTWPAASWSSIDYYGRWKALHYMAKDFYSPLLVTGLEDAEDGSVEVHITNDRPDTVQANLSWAVTALDGNSLVDGNLNISVPPSANIHAHTLELQGTLDKYGSRNLLVWLDVTAGDESSHNLVLLSRPKHLDVLPPCITTDITQAGDSFMVTLNCENPSLWTWLELADTDASLSTNFIHLRPGRSRTINVTPKSTMSLDAFTDQLLIKSLIDTYSC